MFLYQIPYMYKNKENWFYYHRATQQTCCGTNEQIKKEFASLQSQGLLPCDDSKMNAKNLYVIVPHPKKKKTGLRADIKFHRFLGELNSKGECPGYGLCPLLYGLGAYGDGFTYMNVQITEVPITREMCGVALEMVNGKWKIGATK